MTGIIGQQKLERRETVRMKKKQIQVGQDQTETDLIFNFIKQLFLVEQMFSLQPVVINYSDVSVSSEQTEECVSQPRVL